MEYHPYSDLCMPSDHHLTDQYATEYVAPYVLPSQIEAEYEIRNSILVDGGDRFGVSAAVFDKFEELIWMGNQGGHVTSYYGPSMQKYTSFQVHESEEVRAITTLEQGIFALTKTTLRHQIRRGIPKHTFKSSNMTDMQCLYEVGPTNLLIGGHQNSLLDLDLTKMKATAIPITEEGCVVLRSGGGSIVACGSASGSVSLRDSRCPSTAQLEFRPHSACLSDLDMQGNLLITCGFTQSVSGGAVAEPYVVVFDVRHLRGGKESAWSAPTASPPLLLHFLPAFSARAAAVAGDGHVALLQVNSQEEGQSVFQVDTQNSLCTVMDVSNSSQALVFGDQAGHLHLFSPKHNQEPVFNNFSRETEFATQAPSHPFASFSDTTFQYSSVPLPSLTTGNKWFNELPEEFFRRNYRKPKPIDAEVLKTMKMQGPIGYAPNPRTFRRNQMPYVEDTLEDLLSPRNNDVKSFYQPIPKNYQKIDARFNKQGPNELDLENCNKTGFPGLEPTAPNSYCNPMLQVLYYTKPVKATLLAHTCAKEHCLSCELGFLFRTLDSSGGAPCQATNFLRAFRTIPEAAALGLILSDNGPSRDMVALIQSWNRFILHQMHYEILDTNKKEKEMTVLTNGGSADHASAPHGMATPQMNGNYGEYKYDELEFLGPSTELSTPELKAEWGSPSSEEVLSSEPEMLSVPNIELPKQADKEESEISQLFAIGRHQLNRCLKCNKEEEKESVALACLLQYPCPTTAENQADKGEKEKGFVELLLSSLSSRRSTPAWCENCRKFSPTAQRGRVKRLEAYDRNFNFNANTDIQEDSSYECPPSDTFKDINADSRIPVLRRTQFVHKITIFIGLPPILAINCGGVTAHEKAYWSKGTQKEVPDGAKRSGSGKPCRYGLHCARPGCRFKHPDRPGSSTPTHNATKSPTRESNCVLPVQLVIRLSTDGDIIINDKCERTPSVQPCPDSYKSKGEFTESLQEYSLCAAIVCVEDNPKNLVAFVQTGEYEQPSWYLINDLSIQPVALEEVIQCSVWWKTPCVAFYSTRTANVS